MTRMFPAFLVGIALSIGLCTQVPAQAADQGVKVGRHAEVGAGKAAQKTIIARNDQVPQQTCDWIGPGGRAVYRCR